MPRKSILIIIIIVIVLFLYIFFLVFPLALVGPPCSLYYIDNDDDKTHNITVEIFDEDHVSVFKHNYILSSNESINFKREIRWYLPFPSTFITWNDGVYTFNFTVDKNVSHQITRDINQYESICVDLYSEDHQSSEIIPIRIRIVTV